MSGRAATISIIPGKYALSVGRADMPTPKGWRWLALEDVARLESGHTPSRLHPEYWDGGIAWIGIKDARTHHGGVISETFQTVTQAGIDNSAARLLPAKTVCLSRTASVGYVVVMARAMATSQDFVNWVCGPSLDPHFLKQLLIAENESLFRFGKGSTHTTIYYPEVKAFHICLPPLNEQRRIVAKLESLQARSRRAREALDAVPPLLEKLRQSILAAAFRGDLTKDWRAKHRDVEPASELLKRIRVERRKKWEEAELAKLKAKGKAPRDDGWKGKYKEPEPVDEAGLPELPEGWCWATANELSVVVVDCPHSTPVYGSGAFFAVDTTCILPGKVVVSRLRPVTHETYAQRTARLVPAEGDVVFAREGTVGTAVSLPKEPQVCLGQRVMLLRPCSLLVGRWLERALMSPPVTSQYKRRLVGSTVPHLNVSDVVRLACPVPPNAEQQVILERILLWQQVMESLGSSVASARAAERKLGVATLAKAFRGELVPQDPTDEPAADMLSRLRAAEAATPAKPTKSRR